MGTTFDMIFTRTGRTTPMRVPTLLLVLAVMLAVMLGALVFAGPGASAADLGQRLGALPDEGETLLARPSSDELNWSGLYFGVGVGYGTGELGTSGDRGRFDIDQDGTLWSGFAGYNWQQGDGLFGLEADIATGSQTGAQLVGGNTLSSSLNTMGSVRARIGLITGPALMIYGTAGVAFADFDLEVNGGKAQSETFFGYQVGAGAEFMFSSNWTLRMEYLYTDLSPESITQGGLATSYDPDFHTVRAGVALKF